MVEITYQMVLSTLQTIALIVGIIYYLIIMRNSQRNQELTLETRQAQMFMQIYHRLNDPYLQKAIIILHGVDFKDIDDFLSKSNSETAEGRELKESITAFISYYEGVGVLVREGLIDIRYVALLICGMTKNTWEKFKDIAPKIREQPGMKRWASEWEYLYNELMKYLEEHPELKT